MGPSIISLFGISFFFLSQMVSVLSVAHHRSLPDALSWSPRLQVLLHTLAHAPRQDTTRQQPVYFIWRRVAQANAQAMQPWAGKLPSNSIRPLRVIAAGRPPEALSCHSYAPKNSPNSPFQRKIPHCSLSPSSGKSQIRWPPSSIPPSPSSVRTSSPP